MDPVEAQARDVSANIRVPSSLPLNEWLWKGGGPSTAKRSKKRTRARRGKTGAKRPKRMSAAASARFQASADVIPGRPGPLAQGALSRREKAEMRVTTRKQLRAAELLAKRARKLGGSRAAMAAGCARCDGACGRSCGATAPPLTLLTLTRVISVLPLMAANPTRFGCEP